MDGKCAIETMKKNRHFLQNILKDFKPEHQDFRPKPDMMSTAQQIRHIANVIDWFREGALDDKWDMDFEASIARDKAPCTLADAMKHLDEAHARLYKRLEPMTEAEIMGLMKDNPILGACPRIVCLHATNDHTAHHRGALTVYQRLLGIVPTMVYSE